MIGKHKTPNLNRRTFLQCAAAALASTKADASAPKPAPKTTADGINVLFLMTDQQTYFALGSSGNTLIKTPNLDRLAAQGVRFEQAICPTPYCSPARTSILTGLYPHSHGVVLNTHPELQAGITEQSFPATEQILHDAGYATAHRGKWHMGRKPDFSCYSNASLLPGTNHAYAGINVQGYLDQHLPAAQFADDPGETQVYQRPVHMIPECVKAREEIGAAGSGQDVAIIGRTVIPAGMSPEAMITNQLMDLMETHQDKPWMITGSWHPPHALWITPEPYYSMYGRDAVPLPDNLDNIPEWYEASYGKRLGKANGPKGIRELLAIYYSQVTMIDDFIGQVLDKLDALGLTQKTLVIFTADHGDMVGSHGVIGKSVGGFYEHQLRIPMLMRLPGVIAPGTVVKDQVNLVDLMPTILDYAGQPCPAAIEGRSMRPLIDGDKTDWPEYGFCERSNPHNNVVQRMIRGKGWKYIYNVALGKFKPELYHYAQDPFENVNLFGKLEYVPRARRLHAKLREWMIATSDPYLEHVPEDPFKAHGIEVPQNPF